MNLSVEKSFDFAVRIVNLHKYLQHQKKNLSCQNSCSDVEQALVPMFQRRSARKARQTFFPK